MRRMAIIRTLNAPGAVLACVAWALLPLRATDADQSSPAPLGGDPFLGAPAARQQTSASLQPLPEGLGGLTSVDPVDAAAGTDDAVVEPEGFWDRACRWLPQGMIPYVGPRTPDDQKDRGFGLPLEGRGWRSQPFSISAFAGATDGGPMIVGHVDQRPSAYAGVNLGWDYDHYWGIEKRLGFGALNLTNGRHEPIAETGLSVTGEYRLMYYPLGDARWRPFVTAGVGWSDFYFEDDRGAKRLDTVGMIPFGLGLKFFWSERLAVRIDLVDEMTFGDSGLSNFQYVALTAGLEFRYGHRLLRMPWRKSPAVD